MMFVYVCVEGEYMSVCACEFAAVLLYTRQVCVAK